MKVAHDRQVLSKPFAIPWHLYNVQDLCCPCRFWNVLNEPTVVCIAYLHARLNLAHVLLRHDTRLNGAAEGALDLNQSSAIAHTVRRSRKPWLILMHKQTTLMHYFASCFLEFPGRVVFVVAPVCSRRRASKCAGFEFACH